MSIEELEKEIKKLQYQVSIMMDTIDCRDYPVECLILSMNWDEGKIDRVHDIFEKYDNKLERGEKVNWSSFEKELGDKLDIGYQTLKRIVISFYKNSQWSSVCYEYAMHFEPSPPIEFFHITRTAK